MIVFIHWTAGNSLSRKKLMLKLRRMPLFISDKGLRSGDVVPAMSWYDFSPWLKNMGTKIRWLEWMGKELASTMIWLNGCQAPESKY
jgi:hypothetical protein